MQIENHKEEVPFAYYCEKFAAMDAKEAAERTGAVYQDGAFTVTLLGTAYRISHPTYALRADAPVALPKQTFLLRWLLEGRRTPSSNDFLTFREMPWGELYIRPFTGRVLQRAAFSLGTRLDAFRAACEKLHALPLRHGDAGYEFTLLDNYRLRLLLWEADEEFSPSAQLLYSANFADGFAAEDRVVAGDLLLNEIRANM